jgi:hypothetical protein
MSLLHVAYGRLNSKRNNTASSINKCNVKCSLLLARFNFCLLDSLLYMKIDNSSIERVEEFKYFGTTLTNQNSIQVEIKSILKLGNACYYSVQNLLSSRLLSKN